MKLLKKQKKILWGDGQKWTRYLPLVQLDQGMTLKSANEFFAPSSSWLCNRRCPKIAARELPSLEKKWPNTRAKKLAAVDAGIQLQMGVSFPHQKSIFWTQQQKVKTN